MKDKGTLAHIMILKYTGVYIFWLCHIYFNCEDIPYNNVEIQRLGQTKYVYLVDYYFSIPYCTNI